PGLSLVDLIQEPGRRVDDRLARALLEEAVEAGPGLIAAPLVGAGVGDVADVVVGKLEDVSVAIGRASLDLLTEHGEELARHSHEGDVAQDDRLHPGLALLPLHRGELLAHVAEDLDRLLVVGGGLAAVAVEDDGLIVRGLVEVADAERDLAPLA